MAAYDIIAIQMVRDTSFTDIIQGKSYNYNRTHEKEGLPQQVHITQRTSLVKDYIAASNSAIREVSPLELEGLFKSEQLREHNKKAYDFFLAFSSNEVMGNKYDKVFKVVDAIEKKLSAPVKTTTTSTRKKTTPKTEETES